VRDRLLALGAAQVTLREGRGGVFDITVDGRLVWSKRACGRFPDDAEIAGLLATPDGA